MAGRKLNALTLNGRNVLRQNQLFVRHITLGLERRQHVNDVLAALPEISHEPRLDEKWLNAKDYDAMPRPSALSMIKEFMPGGNLRNTNLVERSKYLRARYGDIFRLDGVLGKPDIVFTYDPADFELTYRNEGIWPLRMGLFTFTYYRMVKRPDVFQGVGGLVSEQGKAWADIRNKVNPILMKTQSVRRHLPQVDAIANSLVAKVDRVLDPASGTLRTDFKDDIKMWALESISSIALNTNMGLLSGGAVDPNARQLAKSITQFFELSYKYDVLPSIWTYVETPGFKRFMRVYDTITDITVSYVEAAMRKFEQEQNVEAKSVLEKLCRLDKKVAIVMAMDMLTAGMDTTSAAFLTTLYQIARSPEKQAALRSELQLAFPTPDTPLTADNTKNLPYLRACIKEALRITPITPANLRVTVKDLVLSGYRVPRGTAVHMDSMLLSNTEKYFPRSDEFLPERWLKSKPATCPVTQKMQPFVYLPFGFGPRTCIGKRIAEMEIETLLSKLILKYNVTWTSAEPIKYTSNLVLTPAGEMSFKFEKV